MNDGEQIRGIRAVGSVVTNHENEDLGAISVSSPTRCIDDEKLYETYPKLVMQAANVIEVALEIQGGQVLPKS